MESAQRVIVFEARPYWQPELLRRFLNDGVSVGACRSIRDLEARLRREPADAVVLELGADIEGALRWLGRREERAERTPVIAVAAAEHARLEWHLRELGATAFAHDLIGGRRMAAICRKLWAR